MTDSPAVSPVELATELTVAWLSNPQTRVSAEDVPAFLNTMYHEVSLLIDGGGPVAEEQPSTVYEPAVSARKSLASKDHIISLIDGRAYKTLRRHLSTNGLTPDEYRQRYGLKADYPMVAEAYSESRRAMAKKIGLGRKPGQKVNTDAKGQPKAPKPTSVRAAKAAAQAHLGKSEG